MIFVLAGLCLFLILALTRSHLKIHRLKKTMKLLWSDKWWSNRRIYWASPMCSKCKKQSDRYNDYQEYLEREVCWRCKKKIASPDVPGIPLCLDCYGYQYGLEGFEHYEEKGFSVIEI